MTSDLASPPREDGTCWNGESVGLEDRSWRLGHQMFPAESRPKGLNFKELPEPVASWRIVVSASLSLLDLPVVFFPKRGLP